MLSLRGLLTGGVALFAGYVFYVEPNASQDPVGAISRAATRLATICDRNPHECEYLKDVGSNIGHVGEIGWGVVSGQGRLVYVPHDGPNTAANARSVGSMISIDRSAQLRPSGDPAVGSRGVFEPRDGLYDRN